MISFKKKWIVAFMFLLLYFIASLIINKYFRSDQIEITAMSTHDKMKTSNSSYKILLYLAVYTLKLDFNVTFYFQIPVSILSEGNE